MSDSNAPVVLAHSIPKTKEMLGGCSTAHVYRLHDRGIIDLIKIGGKTAATDESIRRAIATAPRLKRGRPKKAA